MPKTYRFDEGHKPMDLEAEQTPNRINAKKSIPKTP